MLLEIFSVFLPCWQVFKHHSLRQDTLDTIAAWESRYTQGKRSTASTATSSMGTGGSSKKIWSVLTIRKTPASRRPSGTSHSGGSLLSMGALERLLETNPEPLRVFSALKDFSGENVAFLSAVAVWKKTFPHDQGQGAIRDAYKRALNIYTEFISPLAEFPVNISFQEYKHLEAMFEEATRVLYGDPGLATSTILPFAPTHWQDKASGTHSNDSERPIVLSKGNLVELRSSLARLSYVSSFPGIPITLRYPNGAPSQMAPS